jgi:hypothetical protein
MLPLVFVPTYAIVAFAKTIFAVVSIGLLHGLFFLPTLLCALPENVGTSSRKERTNGVERVNGQLLLKNGLTTTVRRNEEEEAGTAAEEKANLTGAG